MRMNVVSSPHQTLLRLLSSLPLFVFIVPSRVKDRSGLFVCPCVSLHLCQRHVHD